MICVEYFLSGHSWLMWNMVDFDRKESWASHMVYMKYILDCLCRFGTTNKTSLHDEKKDLQSYVIICIIRLIGCRCNVDIRKESIWQKENLRLENHSGDTIYISQGFPTWDLSIFLEWGHCVTLIHQDLPALWPPEYISSIPEWHRRYAW